MPQETVYAGFTHEELSAAFDALPKFDPWTRKPTKHWKGEIKAWIAPEQLPVADAAVCFFTATTLEVVKTGRDGRLCVHADGYWMGPAGDH